MARHHSASCHKLFVSQKSLEFEKLCQSIFAKLRFKRGQGTSRFSAQGGHFKVKEGHPDFLQITWFFLNAVLLLYLIGGGTWSYGHAHFVYLYQ